MYYLQKQRHFKKKCVSINFFLHVRSVREDIKVYHKF